MQKILIVEDDLDIQEMIQFFWKTKTIKYVLLMMV